MRLVSWLVVGPPTAFPVRAPVYRGCPCRDPPVCQRVQGDSVAKRQPLLCVVGVVTSCVSCARVRTSRSCAPENTYMMSKTLSVMRKPLDDRFHELSSFDMPASIRSFTFFEQCNGIMYRHTAFFSLRAVFFVFASCGVFPQLCAHKHHVRHLLSVRFCLILAVSHVPEVRHRCVYSAQVHRVACATQAYCNHWSSCLPVVHL